MLNAESEVGIPKTVSMDLNKHPRMSIFQNVIYKKKSGKCINNWERYKVEIPLGAVTIYNFRFLPK